MTMQIIEKAADVTKLIESIQGRGKKLDADIHRAAVSCLHHADKHGDVTLMQKLLVSMPASSRRNAVIAWAEAFGKFEATGGKENSVVYAKGNKTDLEGAMATTPWEFKPEKPFKAFNFQLELKRLLDRAEKAAGDARNEVSDADLSRARQLLA